MIKILLCATMILTGCAVSTESSGVQKKNDMTRPFAALDIDVPDMTENMSDDMDVPVADDGGNEGLICMDSSTACMSGVPEQVNWLCRVGNDCFPPCLVPNVGLVYLDMSDPDAIPLNDHINYVLPCWVSRCATYGGTCPQ